MNDSPSVYKTEAGAVTEQSTWPCLLEAAALDDYLVQPFTENHSALAGLCETEDAVTVRIITEMQDSKTVGYYCAMLEVPGPVRNSEARMARKAGTPFHIIIPISAATGKIRPLSEESLHPSVRAHYKPVYATMGKNPLPYWRQLRESALVAHTLFPDIYAIAWDYVVTPDGPLLLEGNTGWGTGMPQIIHGGLLRDEKNTRKDLNRRGCKRR